MSRHHEELYVRHIQDAIAKAIQWANRTTRSEFMANYPIRHYSATGNCGGSRGTIVGGISPIPSGA